jgi:hypothetical protein
MIFTGNYSDSTTAITFAEIKAAGLGSDLTMRAVPKEQIPNRHLLFWYIERKGLEQSNRNMPVAYCCHQCLHWWLPSFSPTWAGENANESLPVCAKGLPRTG